MRFKRWFKNGRQLAVSALFALVMVLASVKFAQGVQQKNIEVKKQSLENTLQKCITHCYATAGTYPPDVDYIVEKYGLTYDEEHFVINYRLFAANIYPEITVMYNY